MYFQYKYRRSTFVLKFHTKKTLCTPLLWYFDDTQGVWYLCVCLSHTWPYYKVWILEIAKNVSAFSPFPRFIPGLINSYEPRKRRKPFLRFCCFRDSYLLIRPGMNLVKDRNDENDKNVSALKDNGFGRFCHFHGFRDSYLAINNYLNIKTRKNYVAVNPTNSDIVQKSNMWSPMFIYTHRHSGRQISS